jgi:hypothetical protein
MTDVASAASAARSGVARTAAAESGRIRRCSATALLALLGAAALAPLAVAGTSGLGAALAGVAGNLGSGLLGGVIEKAVERLRDGKPGPEGADILRDEIAAELLAALKRDDAAARELRAELTDVLVRVGGIEAAIGAVGDDVGSHLRACFSELAGQQGEAIKRLRGLDAGQRRQELRLEEMADRLRLLTSLLADQRPATGPRSAPSDGGSRTAFQLFVTSSPATAEGTWRAGSQVLVGECVYLLHGDLVEERFSADHSVLFRQAQALRMTPSDSRRRDYCWLRQAEARQRGPAVEAAVGALHREHDLLAGLRRVRGLPRAAQLAAGAATGTLVLGWPASRSMGGACETLAAGMGYGYTPADAWSIFRLFTGLAGLCTTLDGLHAAGVAHRCLTPAGIIVLDDSRLALRDAGLAAWEPRRGEGPAEYQAPEQRLGSTGRTGPATDCYQIAAVTCHLISGHPPHPRTPLPLRAQVPAVPGRLSTAIAAALAADPAHRPDIRTLGETFRAACDDLS